MSCWCWLLELCSCLW